MPPAPARFSATTGWPHTSCSFAATARPMMSVELPGVNEKEVELSITGDVLSLKGERMQETKPEGFHRGERWYGRFERHLSLPISVHPDKAKATFRDGVLTITLPKVEEIKPKSIKIDVL